MFQFNYSSKFLFYVIYSGLSYPQIHVTMSVNDMSLSSAPMLLISVCENPLEFFFTKNSDSPDSFLSQRGVFPFFKHPSDPLSLLIIFCGKLSCLWSCPLITDYLLCHQHRNVLQGAGNHPQSQTEETPLTLLYSLNQFTSKLIVIWTAYLDKCHHRLPSCLSQSSECIDPQFLLSKAT